MGQREITVRDVYVVGVGMTHFGRFPDQSVRSLAEEAIGLALADAGASHGDVEAIAFANAVQDAMEGQFGIRGQVALSRLPFDAVPIINVENACASGSSAASIAPCPSSGSCARSAERRTFGSVCAPPDVGARRRSI